MDLGLIGNCAIAGLVDRGGRLVWLCLPRFDGEPVFHALLGHGAGEPGDGAFAVEIDGQTGSEQSYDTNSAILRTRLFGAAARWRSSISSPGFPPGGAPSARRR